MKKQQSGKKNLKWILLGAALVVALAVLAVILVLGGGSEEKPAAEPLNTKLYWNVDRMEYVAKGMNGASGRMPRSDGYYYVRFAVEGEQIDIPVAERDIVDRIDTFDLMGLVLDQDGVCVDIMQLHEFTGGLAANMYYVESVEGTTVRCNTSGVYKGVSVDIEIPESANIYDVGGQGLLVGMPGDVEPDDQILAVKNEEGTVTDVFVVPYLIPGDIYWNITRKYDSTAKISLRERNTLGYFEFQMCHGGQIITVKTREVAVANQIDGFVAQCMGLEFDEDGFVIGTRTAGSVTGGAAVASWYHVMQIDGNNITAKKFGSSSEAGTVVTVSPGRYCQTVLTSTGEYTQLQVGDMIHCLQDSRGRLAYIFIVSRPSPTAKVYWNVERQYDSAKKETTRVPSGGYYYFKLAVDGKQVTLKTDDREIATKIDSFAAKCFALEVDGDRIVSVHGTGVATGGSVTMSWFNVDSVQGNTITATKRSDEKSADYGKTVTAQMAEDCKIYNVGATALTVGEETTVRVDDQIHCLTNYRGEIIIVYVVNRPISSKIYYNLTRMYDSEKQMTTRERAEDGYYYFLMAVDGQQVTLKTKDQDVANEVDSRAGKCMGLSLKGDVILKSYNTGSVKGYTGGIEVSYCDVIQINGRTVIAERTLSGADHGKKYTVKMSRNCQIYDVTSAYVDHAGEATTLRLGDMIHCLRDENKNTVLIYVVSRKIQGKVGWNVDRQWDAENKTTKRVPDADGWYTIVMAIDGQQQTLKTKDIELINAIDSQAAMCRGLVLEGDELKRVVSPSSVIGTDGGVNGSWVNVTEVTGSGCKAIKIGGVEDGTTYDISMAKDCKIYNVSNSFKSHKGEETTLKYGALIHALINADGDATIIYVITDGIEGATQGYCNVCKKDVTWAVWNGSDALVNNVHYYLTEDIHMDTYVTVSGANATLFLNGHTVTSDSRAFKLTSSAVLNIYDSRENGKDIGGKIIAKGITADEIVAENNGNASEGGVVMLWNSNVTLNLYSGTLQLADENNGVKNGGVVTGAGVFNMYGGCVIGAQVSLQGGSIRLFGAKAQFNMYGGTVTGGQANNGGNISAENGAAVMIKGGTVSNGIALNGTADVSGGNLFLHKSTATVTGGSIIGGQAPHGGNIALNSASKLTMTGGTITEGKAVTLESVGNGGNIYVTTGSAATVTGGTVTKGQARRGGNFAVFGDATVSGVTVDAGAVSHDGACFFTYNQGKLTLHDISVPAAENGKQSVAHSGAALTLSGKIVLPLVIVRDTTVTIGAAGLDNASAIGINDQNITTSFATVPESADKDCFYSVTEDYAVAMDENKALFLKSTAKPHIHCVCGGSAVGVHDHQCADMEWTPFPENVTAMSGLPSGNYYLTKDVSLSDGKDLGKDAAKNISICLNGHTMSSTGRVLGFVYGGSVINFCDCSGEQAADGSWTWDGAVKGTTGSYGAIGYICSKSVVNVYGGSFTNTSATANCAPVILMSNDGCADYNGNGKANEAADKEYAEAGSILNVYNGEFYYNGTLKASANIPADGGIIGRFHSPSVNIHGGLIRGTNAGNGGAIALIGKGTLTITGGTITGGSATSGGAIYANNLVITGGTITGNKSDQGGAICTSNASSKLQISGDAQITGNTTADGSSENNIYLYAGQTLTLGQLEAAAQMGITMAQPGDIATGVTADVTSQVTSDNDRYSVQYAADQQKLSLQAAPHRDHCVCGGQTVGVADHTDCTPLTWTAWSNPSSLPTTSGNYYLTTDVSFSTAITTEVDSNINLCLNGHTVRNNERIWLKGNFALTDCDGNGAIISTFARHSAIFYTYERCQLRLYAGTLDGSGAGQNYGVVSLCNDDTNGNGVKEASYFYMYGGTIKGRNAGSATGSGAVMIMHNAQFHMYGGTITGGQAVNGSAVYVGNVASVLNIQGGTITGNRSDGGAIYIATGNTNVTISGNARITGNMNAAGTMENNVYLQKDQTLKFGELAEDAQVGITMAQPGNIALNVTKDITAQVTSDNSAFLVVYGQTAQKLSLQLDGTAHAHCLCNGNKTGDHTDCTQLNWMPLTQAMFDTPDGTTVKKTSFDVNSTREGTLTVYVLAGGNYYLDGDIQLDHMIQLEKATVNLCLNGNTLTSSSRVFRLTNTSVLSVTDCGQQGQLVGKGASDAQAYEEQGNTPGGVINNEGGVVILWSSNTTFKLYGGTLRLASAEEGSSSTILNGGVVSGSGRMVMYGGTVQDGRATNQGGNIRLWSNNTGVLIVYGGTVKNGQAANGGNIAVDGASGSQTHAYLYGGTVTGGKASGNGGGVYITANGYLTLGGTVQITGNTGSDLFMPAGKTLAVEAEGFQTGAKIGIKLGSGAGTIAENVTADLSGWFESNDTAYQVGWENNKLVLR